MVVLLSELAFLRGFSIDSSFCYILLPPNSTLTPFVL